MLCTALFTALICITKSIISPCMEKDFDFAQLVGYDPQKKSPACLILSALSLAWIFETGWEIVVCSGNSLPLREREKYEINRKMKYVVNYFNIFESLYSNQCMTCCAS